MPIPLKSDNKNVLDAKPVLAPVKTYRATRLPLVHSYPPLSISLARYTGSSGPESLCPSLQDRGGRHNHYGRFLMPTFPTAGLLELRGHLGRQDSPISPQIKLVPESMIYVKAKDW